MTFGPGKPNVLQHKEHMGRLREVQKGKDIVSEPNTQERGEKKEISPELRVRLLAFDNAAHEYTMFMHEYFDKKNELWEDSDREDELFNIEYGHVNGIVSRLLKFLRIDSGNTEQELEDIQESAGKVAVEFLELHKALDTRKQELEDALNAYGDLFEDPIEVAYLAVLETAIENRPSAQK